MRPPVSLGINTLKLDIGSVEKYYGAVYVGEFPFPKGDGFLETPVSIFWRPEKFRTANFSEYFAILSVTKGPFGPMYAVEEASYITGYIFNGLLADGVVVYSRYTEDKHHINDSTWIEGGFEYCEHEGGELVRLQVQNGKVVLLD